MFNLTQEERRVVLFLVALSLCGIGIDFFSKKCAAFKVLPSFSQEIGKINLNQADEQRLIEVPGIGKKLARRIIEYKNREGNFTELEGIKKVKGISAYRYGKIKDSLYIK